MDKRTIESEDIHALQIVHQLQPWRTYLAGKVGSTHANATLELIDVLIVMLTAFYNPLVRSQRLIDALSSQQWMQQRMGVGRVARSTLSDALRRFDPETLRPLIEQLTRHVPALQRRDADLATITRQILAADGSYFNLAGEVAWAICTRRDADGKKSYAARLDLQLDVRTFSPVDCDLSSNADGGEAAVLSRRLKREVIYVMDRGYLSFALLNAVLDADSNFVLRLKKHAGVEVIESRELTQRDRDLGVLSDEVVRLTGPRSKGNADARSCTDRPPTRLLRRVTVWDPRNKTEVTLLTDLLDAPAYVIGELYRQRWQIELFFKWLKCWAQFDHAFSQHPAGLTLQFYVAVIGTLLLHIATGRRVNKYAVFWLSCVAGGQATWAEMQAGLARIEHEKDLERARLARKRLASKKQD